MAKILQNQYYVYKIPSNKSLLLKTYSSKEAFNDGNVVSVGDNLVFSKIREYYGDSRSHIELYDIVQNIRKEMSRLKKENNSSNRKQLLTYYQNRLDSLLFVPDIINIKVMKKKEYSKIARNGFDLNGKHYIRFMCGSGQMRRNTITFLNEELYPYLEESLMCGLNEKIKTINLAKLSAYFALSFSSVLWVRRPRVCVIKDFSTIIPNQKINWISKDNKKYNIDIVNKDIELNSADGQGLISPTMAAYWAQDMCLDYIPCSFVVRTTFIKGNLVTFDFHEYAKKYNISKIKDRYGTEYNISDIDVLLSESQFKMAKMYSSWETYESYHSKYNLKWGVARYNKMDDDKYTLTNYQYLQVLNLSKEDVLSLLKDTTDWIKKICSGDPFYSVLYSIGVGGERENLNEYIEKCGSFYTKAIIKNSSLLDDSYIQRKIYQSIKESIRQAKMGRLWVQGNYQFMISDPVAQCRNALGLSAEGLIPAKSIYSNFWKKETNPEEIVCCRSPLTYYSEVNPLKIFDSEDASYWYRYIYSGIIYSIYDISTVIHADSDFDGDIVFSTDNPCFVKGARRDELPISYDKEKVPMQRITLPNQIKCDIRGLDTKVGQITNYSTSMMAMLPLFKKDDKKEQWQEIINRLKICRNLQGEEIDKIKGTTPPQFPKEWHKWKKTLDGDSDQDIKEKYKYNSMVVKKKPYFFIYLYPSLNSSYKEYLREFNYISKIKFNIGIKDLIKKEKKSLEEIELVRKYQKYCPVLETDCIMNTICKEIENQEFDIKFNKNKKNLLFQFSDEIELKEKDDLFLSEIYSKYKSKKRISGIKALVENNGLQKDDLNEILNSLLYLNRDECREDLYSYFGNSRILFNSLCSFSIKNNIDDDFVWNMMRDDIISFIPTDHPYSLIENSFGVYYLGKKYSKIEIEE